MNDMKILGWMEVTFGIAMLAMVLFVVFVALYVPANIYKVTAADGSVFVGRIRPQQSGVIIFHENGKKSVVGGSYSAERVSNHE